MIDLRSDTVTRPGAGMREAMAAAEVGDDVMGEDPTVNRLQDRAAALLGKERALFVPSGTMANLLAFVAQTRPGESILLHQDAHPFHYEGGNVAVVGGLLTRLLPGAQGRISAETLAGSVIRSNDHHLSNTTVVALENTTNRGGGAFYTEAAFAAIAGVAHEQGLRVHCDGARLFNAVTATGTPPDQYARHCDTVSFCLSKGLGAPVGSILAGDEATLEEAHRYRKMLGGGMRQAGILAAAGLYALEHQVPDLAEDHRRAAWFRQTLATQGLTFPLPSPTNIVYVEVAEAPKAVVALAQAGVKVFATGPKRLRVVFHRDISDADTEAAVEIFSRTLLS